MKIINKSCPRLDPWDASKKQSNFDENWFKLLPLIEIPLTSTNCALFFRYEENHSRTTTYDLRHMSLRQSFSTSKSWFTQSKALIRPQNCSVGFTSFSICAIIISSSRMLWHETVLLNGEDFFNNVSAIQTSHIQILWVANQ